MSELCRFETDSAVVVSFEERAARIRSARDLRLEVAASEAAHGANPYTEFVLRHGCRPDRDQAAAIGRLMGVQVRAADGTLQPPATKGGKHKRKNRKSTEGDYLEQILKLRSALANLAQIEGDPAVLIRYMDPFFGDASAIREHLPHAVHWINRFAEEWVREQGTHGSQGPV